MTTIELLDLRLLGYHGIYDEEPHVGNEYLVNLAVSFEETPNQFSTIAGTVNYEELYEIVRQRMQVNTPLLEKLCEGIIGRIRHQYPFVSEVKLSIYKLQAAIQNLQGKVGVTMYRKFNGK